MTQRTINLYDGLELLYYMDSDFVDFGSNTISDMSGHGRHGDVNGGITFGENGLNDLKSANFNSSSEILTSGIDDFDNFNTLTFFGIVKLRDETADIRLFRLTPNQAMELKSDSGAGLTLRVNRFDEDFKLSTRNDLFDEHIMYAVRFDETSLELIISRFSTGSFDRAVRNTSSGVPVNTPDTVVIGEGASNADHTLFGASSRLLSDAELKLLSRLTATRQQLL
jgi:hypothetical protein